MNNDELIQLLMDYKSYKYALTNVGHWDTGMPLILADRIIDPNRWDATRYSRIVGMIEGAVNELLSDNQRMVIVRLYTERNRCHISDIATETNRDRGTIGRWHREALRRLRKALDPLGAYEREISNIDHMFDKIGA